MSAFVGGIEAGGTKFVCGVGTGPDDIRSEERFPTTTPEETIRRRSWDHLKRLVELAAQLGGGVLVLGSPKQRNRPPLP